MTDGLFRLRDMHIWGYTNEPEQNKVQRKAVIYYNTQAYTRYLAREMKDASETQFLI